MRTATDRPASAKNWPEPQRNPQASVGLIAVKQRPKGGVARATWPLNLAVPWPGRGPEGGTFWMLISNGPNVSDHALGRPISTPEVRAAATSRFLDPDESARVARCRWA